MLRQFRRKTRRLVFAFMGVALVLMGVAALSTGRPAYRNYKGQWVFAPVAIVLGVGSLAMAFLPDRRKPRGRRSS